MQFLEARNGRKMLSFCVESLKMSLTHRKTAIPMRGVELLGQRHMASSLLGGLAHGHSLRE